MGRPPRLIAERLVYQALNRGQQPLLSLPDDLRSHAAENTLLGAADPPKRRYHQASRIDGRPDVACQTLPRLGLVAEPSYFGVFRTRRRACKTSVAGLCPCRIPARECAHRAIKSDPCRSSGRTDAAPGEWCSVSWDS